MNLNQENILGSMLSDAGQIIRGKDDILKLAVISFFSGGHLLIEDLPGVGKTTLAKTMAKLLNLDFNRVQMTNDLLPSDILGYKIFIPKKESFEFTKGPLFTEILLADELNRASPKTQSALLQAMEERKVSLEGQAFNLSENFFVIATQNPYGQIGTFPLPESQLDRFAMKISIGTPSLEIETELLRGINPVEKIKDLISQIDRNLITKVKQDISGMHVSEELSKYIVLLLQESRNNSQFQSLSPRAGLDLVQIIKSKAYFENREFATSEDVLSMAKHVWGHRIASSSQGGIQSGHNLVDKLLQQVKAI